MNVITKQLAEKLPDHHKLLSNHIVNPEDYLALFSLLKETNRITIFDATTTNKYPSEHIISVSDHINRTGKNPLIGHQQELDIDFIDITKLYKIEKLTCWLSRFLKHDTFFCKTFVFIFPV